MFTCTFEIQIVLCTLYNNTSQCLLFEIFVPKNLDKWRSREKKSNSLALKNFPNYTFHFTHTNTFALDNQVRLHPKHMDLFSDSFVKSRTFAREEMGGKEGGLWKHMDLFSDSFCWNYFFCASWQYNAVQKSQYF